ncbi:hypothetical protein [Nocardioides sp.]|uniref:hypothetical protein n=1 Tax=Nocardioides sp. TaxID=35761 RepID=UPI002ED032EF
MNDTPQGLPRELSRQLHAQVDATFDHGDGAPLTLDDVKGKARSIRRRRTALAAGVGAAAMLAVILPAGLALDDPGNNRPSPAAPSPSEAVEPTPNPDGTFPLTLDVPEGEVPRTGYIAGDARQLVTPDATFDLPGDFLQIAPYDDGWVGIRGGGYRPLGYQVVVLDSDLQELSAVSSNASLAISADGSRVAWVEARGNGGDWTVVNAPVDGGEPMRTPTSANAQVEGFIAPDTVAVSHFDEATGDTSYGQAGPDGEFDAIPFEGFQRVGGVTEVTGLVAGQTEFRGDSTCSEVRNTDTAQPRLVLETCDHQLGAFSPDGRWLIGYATYFDLGSPTVAILDAATGDPVVEYASSRKPAESAVVMAAAWEDDDTVVAVVEQGGEQAVLRLEADGTATRVSDVRDAEMSIEFFLPQHLFAQ